MFVELEFSTLENLLVKKQKLETKEDNQLSFCHKKFQHIVRVLKNITYFDQRSFLDIKKPLITGF